MANLTPEPDTQDLLKRNVLGPAIFVLGAFVAVMMALDWKMSAGTGFVGDLARSVKGGIGALPAFLAGAGTAWAGARLFLQNEPDDTLHHLTGWILVSLALALVLAPIRTDAGGIFGTWITGRWKVLGFFIGLAALFAPVWFFWLRDRFVLPDESEMPESLSQTLLDEGGAGISAEEADALLPMDDESYQPARQNPKLAALLAESLAKKESISTGETKAPSPYPDDVRKSGGIPVGTVPIAAPARDKDGNIAFAAGVDADLDLETSDSDLAAAAKDDSKGSEGVHRWAPKERRLAGQTLGEDPLEEAQGTEKAPRKLQVNQSGAKALSQEVRPIEDMVDIPPRPIWEAEEAGDDTAGAIADALFGDGPIGPVRTLPHDAPGAADTIAADAERIPEFTDELPELVEFEDAELEDEEEGLEDGEVYDLDGEEYEDEDEEEYEDDEAAELEEDVLEDEDEEEYEDEDDEEAAELEDDEEYEEDEDAEAAELEEGELEDDEEEEYEDEEEAAELDEEDPEEDEEYEYEDEEAAELEEDELEGEPAEDEEAAEYEEAAELDDEEEYEEEAAELEDEPELEPEPETARAESEVVLTPKAPPAPAPSVAAKAVDSGGRVSPEIVYDAGVLFLERGRVAVSLLQREFSLDFDESCEVMDRLQKLGLIGPYVGGHRRDILLSREEWLEKATVG